MVCLLWDLFDAAEDSEEEMARFKSPYNYGNSNSNGNGKISKVREERNSGTTKVLLFDEKNMY